MVYLLQLILSVIPESRRVSGYQLITGDSEVATIELFLVIA
jgi:hypothetical protein